MLKSSKKMPLAGSPRLLISLIGTIALLSLFLEKNSFAQGSQDIALILKTIGTVEVNAGQDGDWMLAKRGMRLSSGHVIRTGDKSLAAIVFTDDKSLIKIRANSEITIKGTREEKRVTRSIFMRLGDLWAKVTKGNPFQVETPSGVAAVKGTEFYVLVGDLGGMFVFCRDGLIELLHRLGRMELNPGERGEMDPTRGPVKTKVGPGEMPNWADSDDVENELRIEFEKDGVKKYLKIRYK